MDFTDLRSAFSNYYVSRATRISHCSRPGLDQERKGILDRLELVNESLLSAEFNQGTHLVIEPLDRTLEDVRLFKANFKGSSQPFIQQ